MSGEDHTAGLELGGDERGERARKGLDFARSHAAILPSCRAETLARTRAAAIGGGTLLPHMRTWAVFVSAFPRMTTLIR